jgi:hypothetical protein
MTIKNSLKDLKDSITVNKPKTCEELINIIKNIDFKPIDFKEFQYFEHSKDKSYGRKIVYQGENFSIYLMSWYPGDFTAIHSHGLTDWGCVFFFSDTNHRLYKTEGNKIELIAKGIIPKGTIAPVTGELIHAMGNLSLSPILTLHIYGSNKDISNANDESKVYELEKNRIRTTGGAAYLNIPEELCKKTENSIVTNEETITDYFEIIKHFYSRFGNNETSAFIKNVLYNPKLYFTTYYQ